MREILFRGKHVDNGKWVEGFYGQFHNRPTINEPNIHQIFVLFTEEEEKENEGHIFSAIGGIWHTVIPETVGQFTGLTDKNGIEWLEKTPRTESGYIDLYTILDRVSCWCCANKNAWELWNIWYYLPQYWERLKEMQSKLDMPMKKFKNKKFGEYGNVFDLEKVFESGYVPKHRKRR